jgi:ABC-type lipoprotein export system ATPase subunit
MHEARQTEPLLQLIDVCKYYADGDVHALRNVNLIIPRGQTLAIVGPSGCGKSTLLNILGTLDHPTQGQVLFEGRSIAEIDTNRLRSSQIGFVFQSFYLLPNLTALENVQIPMFEGSLNSGQRISRATELLKLVGLENRLNHLPRQLSNGQRQRVAIARSLANQPAIILADEPTGSLDSNSGREIIELLFQLNQQQQTTLIIVTHDLALAQHAERVLQMLDGAVVKDEIRQTSRLSNG